MTQWLSNIRINTFDFANQNGLSPSISNEIIKLVWTTNEMDVHSISNEKSNRIF